MVHRLTTLWMPTLDVQMATRRTWDTAQRDSLESRGKSEVAKMGCHSIGEFEKSPMHMSRTAGRGLE